jgi:hypothetical protein
MERIGYGIAMASIGQEEQYNFDNEQYALIMSLAAACKEEPHITYVSAIKYPKPEEIAFRKR